jgi:hypothetical protein
MHEPLPVQQRDRQLQAGTVSRARRALLLVNQHARRGGEAIDAALAVLAAGEVTVEEHDYPKRDPIPAAIRAGAFDCVIVGGGDGTLHAAPALVETGLPLGTGKDLARSLRIDPDPVMAARVIAEGQTRAIDLGEVNGHLFWNVASLGLSVELAQQPKLLLRRRIARQLVGDQDARRPHLLLEQLTQQALGRLLVAPALHQHVEHDAVLVDRPPQPVLLAGDGDHHLIEMPLITGTGQPAADLVGEGLAELECPLPHRLMADEDDAGRQHLLDHAKAQRKRK